MIAFIILVWVYCLISIATINKKDSKIVKAIFSLLRIVMGVLFGYIVFLSITEFTPHTYGDPDFSLLNILTECGGLLLYTLIYSLPIIIIAIVVNCNNMIKNNDDLHFYSTMNIVMLNINVVCYILAFLLIGDNIFKELIEIGLAISSITVIIDLIICKYKIKKDNNL